MNLLQIKLIFVFLLAALLAPQVRHNHPAHNSDLAQRLSAADHQTEIGFAVNPSSARLTFDVSRFTSVASDLTHLLHEAVSAVIATSLEEARHA